MQSEADLASSFDPISSSDVYGPYPDLDRNGILHCARVKGGVLLIRIECEQAKPNLDRSQIGCFGPKG